MSDNSTNYCKDHSGVHAVDTSFKVTKKFLDRMRVVGVSTIIRYYDWEEETIPDKTLRKNETGLIRGEGFQLAVVFQHNNDKFSSFTEERGRIDTERSLELAAENNQPSGSGIYFGVDGDWPKQKELEAIGKYFTAVNSIIMRNGGAFRVGGYGSGKTLQYLLAEELAELMWLANPPGWIGYDKFLKSKKWHLRQLLPGKCGGRSVDFDFCREDGNDFGQFS